ncbi:MAG: glutathione S-transferase [Methylobacterium sp.]|uniref:glutathione S-transferase family protein n=1 Tax=Methylobacterium sp. TaxID=409 RepID=UPI00271A4B2A|nr:glutathione S-transferase [Methylobacterium sp.]MDO9426775.1 glutathione S-transferase [Methylobacterium sp.]
MASEITLYHSPNTRSTGVRILLEELGAPHRLQVLNMKAGEHREAAYRAINPMGKVPALTHGDAVVTEQAAIYLYLADLFPGAGLTAALDDPLRGPYLRWMVYYGSSFEPAVIDRALQREAGPRAMSAYGDFDTVMATLLGALDKGPYLLGERFTAVDVLWGTALGWTTSFKLVPEEPAIRAYIDRVNGRPAAVKVAAADAALSAEHAASQEAEPAQA